MDEQIKKAVVMENYQNPKNRGLIKDDTYNIVKAYSKTCIDQLDLQLKIVDNIIIDVRFDGEACAICTSSTSILIKNIIGKTIDEAIDMINNFENMIEENPYKKDVLKEAIVYEDISKQPNRKQCALISWKELKRSLEGEKND